MRVKTSIPPEAVASPFSSTKLMDQSLMNQFFERAALLEYEGRCGMVKNLGKI